MAEPYLISRPGESEEESNGDGSRGSEVANMKGAEVGGEKQLPEEGARKLAEREPVLAPPALQGKLEIAEAGGEVGEAALESGDGLFEDVGGEEVVERANTVSGHEDSEPLVSLSRQYGELVAALKRSGETRREGVEKISKGVEALWGVQESLNEALMKFDGMLGDVDTTVRDSADQLRIYREDVKKWSRRKSGVGWQVSLVVVVVLVCMGLFGGMSIQQQFSLLDVPDASGGWREHIWQNYGRAIVECAVEAQRRGGSEIDCTLRVRAP